MSMSTETASVVMLGAGGHARVLVQALYDFGVNVEGFVAPQAEGSRLGTIPWLGDDNALPELDPDIAVVNGIGSVGSTQNRASVYASALSAGLRFHTVIHPKATLDSTARVGSGAQILAGSVVGVGAVVGTDAVVNSGAIIDHDSTIGMHAHIGPGAILAGDVVVGDGSHIGMGARVIQGVTIGELCVVGAGAVVLEDVPNGCTVVGVPAKHTAVRKGS